MDVNQIATKINQEIAALQYGQHPPELYEPIRYMMSLGGKRLRPVLTLLATSLYTDDWQRYAKPALAVEVFHNFTLMHDDIMDAAPLRRGKPTVHTQWNNNVAILSGDVMLVNAYELLLELPAQQLAQVIRRFNRCAAEVCEGQQLDMNFEKQPGVTEEDYLEMIRLKTAALLGFSLELGGLMVGADHTDTTLLYELGESIGIGFQLKDDLLDVFGEQAKVGKQVGGDIMANKKTFLLIKALQEAQEQDLEELTYWLNQPSFVPEEKVKAITAIYERLDIRQIAENKMNEYFALGMFCLDRLHANTAKKEALKQFIEQIIAREN
ncbi:polyprenyl synthetase family protein [Rhodocytophaga aerolata]|uniref:Polyprenyl synthetase family protein n=1 Tax=Rhodocytophaga aerolata TaxID=455078 RepID=A0ABT8QY43_9BACT|nr:polyprenyl synthetase family protein [Rhodocytophaga aerolata]MDO1444757.1 polyprenyl synthetase family protein [Rhodocytophaga aerolata]